MIVRENTGKWSEDSPRGISIANGESLAYVWNDIGRTDVSSEIDEITGHG